MERERIEWIDISRGILIILMVVGHSTSQFNHYIYQFHMAAFFILSGYVANIDRKGFFDIFFNKFFTVLLPVFTTVVFGSGVMWLLHIKHYDIVISSLEFPGWREAIKAFLIYGNIYVEVLGATWFLSVLFAVCLLNKMIYLLTNKFLLGYGVISLTLYLLGYGIIKQGITPSPHVGMFSIDLIFIANLFYAIGYIAQKTAFIGLIKKSYIIQIGLGIVSMLYMRLISSYLHVGVDWPSRTFKNPFFDGVSALNGFIFILSLSLLFSSFTKKLRKVLKYIGKNTLGILIFHFSFFKIMYIPFCWLKVIDKSDFACITPGRMSSLTLNNQYWSAIAIGAIGLSLVTWKIISYNRHLRFLFGQDKQSYAIIWNMLINSKVVGFLSEVTMKVFKKENKENGLGISRKIDKLKGFFWIPIFLLLLISAVTLYFYKPNAGSSLQDCIKQEGYFEDGWVERSSKFLIRTEDEGNICIEIYCPLSSFDDKKIDVYINETLVETVELQTDYQIIQIDTERNQIVQLGFETNFVQENLVADKRELAMVILSLEAH